MPRNENRKGMLYKPLNNRRKIDVARALELRLIHHYTYEQIANVFGVHRTAVFQALQKILNLLDSPELVTTYKRYKSEMLSKAELELLNRVIDSKKLEKASVNNIAYAFSQIFNANRLESGKSTANISYADATKQISELEEREKEIEAELAKLRKDSASDVDTADTTADDRDYDTDYDR